MIPSYLVLLTYTILSLHYFCIFSFQFFGHSKLGMQKQCMSSKIEQLIELI